MATDTNQKGTAIHGSARTSHPNRDFPIVVHSHLGWDWVWQRPQQFLSRLSRRHRILFVEEPRPTAVEEPRVTLREVPDYPNIVVVQTEFPECRWHDRDFVDQERLRLVRGVLEGPLGAEFENPVQWFYDPMAVTAFAGQMGERAIVYDCMDQLSQFRGAPPTLVSRERELLAVADVVFAGGPKIHRAKSAFHDNCHAFGCGVDSDHFASARAHGDVPEEIAHLQGPVLGFFGVVDERMDYDLIARLADARADWHLVLVGPRTKVDEEVLPRRANVHWLGGRDYNRLPSYVRRFDVCLMPFALNEATEFINPTKALEYMAAGKPIVSSAIDDVVLQFSAVVDVARSHDEFVELCIQAVERPDGARIERGIDLARRNSWEAIVWRLKRHIDQVLDAREAEPENEASTGNAA